MTLDAKIRFPRETDEYRRARNGLLEAEVALRRAVEEVAAARRTLPAGAPVPEDYALEDEGGRTTLSQLFPEGKDTLILYSFMYGPEMERPCPSCTSILDSLDGAAPHVTQHVGLAAVAKSPMPRIRDFARERGWRHLCLVSSHGTTYNRDYHGETPDGAQMPMVNVFVKDDVAVRHSWGCELLYAPTEEEQENRHVDLIWPIWNLLDLTPRGRPRDWNPRLRYD